MDGITKFEATETQKGRVLRVAAYARVSTNSEDQLKSLEAQKKHYESYIKGRTDWEFAGLYYDEGISGTKMEKREGLLSLLADCEKGHIDYIIVKSISRFSRNTVDSIETVRKLSMMGIYIFFEKEKIDTGKMKGELLLSVLSSLAENESRSISDNANWGIQKRFRSGTYKIGYTPYGYKNEDGRMVIDDAEAETVRWIFAELLSGSSSAQIARRLNEMGAPTKRNSKWQEGTINGMIRNEKYTGDAIFQKTFTDEQFFRHTNYGERTQYLVKGHHEAIISREDFEAANCILDRNGKEKGVVAGEDKWNKRYAFSGKILCGECGYKWKRIKVEKHFCYACTGHMRDKDSCSIKSIPEDKIKDAFTTMMNKLTFARNRILIPLSEELDRIGREGSPERLQEINDGLENICNKRKQARYLSSRGFLDPMVLAKTNAMLNEKEAGLLSEKRQIELSLQADESEKNDIAELIRFTGKRTMLTEFVDEVFSGFVDHIVVYSRTEIGFAMNCGPVFRERID